jgi:uridine kinase
MNARKPFIIGITGSSCSGKTTIALSAARRFEAEGRASTVISTDSYYRDLSHMPIERRATHNFDDPSAIEFELLREHLDRLSHGKSAEIPEYRFATHTRAPRDEWRTLAISTDGNLRPAIIVEGLHALYPPDIRDLLDLSVFIDLPVRICMERRIERDVRERGRTREQIVGQLQTTVFPMYAKYVLPVKRFADLVIDGETPIEETVDRVTARARAVMAESDW